MLSFCKFVLIFFSIIITSLSCTVSNKEHQNISEMHEKYMNIAIEKFSSPVKYLFNDSKTKVICLNFDKENHPQLSKFFVYNIEKDIVLYENSVPQGKIKWISDNILEIGVIPGIVSGKEGEESKSNVYYYDVNLQKRISEPFNEISN